MTQQYLRNCSLIVADQNGTGLELGALRVTFEVRRGDTQTPNTADVKVWNLSTATSNRLRGIATGSPEFQYLRLSVSYGNNPLAQIFSGTIKQIRQGREDQKDSYIAITAADGDQVYNFAPVAFTMAAGRTAPGTVQNLIAAGAAAAEIMSKTKAFFSADQQLAAGYIPVPALDPDAQIRGRVFFGGWRDEMRDFAQDQDCKWWIDDGKLSVVPLTSYIPGGTVLITPSTGLIGVPEQTQNGLSVRVLMNPNIKIGHTIKLDSDITELRMGLDTQSVANNLSLQQGAAKQNANGLYYVMKAEHTGDTRGTQWYTDLTCLSVDATVAPASSTSQTTVVPVDAIPRY